MMTHWSARRLFWFWFVIGCLTAVVLQIGQVEAMGGRPESLLFVGDRQEVAPLVVEELPAAPVWEGYGHDGQIFYAVGLDLSGHTVPDTLLSASYRYRRILYPALSSGFGVLDGRGLLWGMIVWAATPVGLAAGALALLARDRGLSSWFALGVVLNPGVWLSARLLTADNLALALGLLGVLAFTRRRDALAVVALAGAALTREPAVVFAVALAGDAWFTGQRRRAVVALTAVVPLVLWLGYVHIAIGSVLDAGGNTALPGMGIIEAASVWATQRPRDNIWVGLALLAMIGGGVAAARTRDMWAWLVGMWILVGLVASSLVWNVGNNAIRTLSPIVAIAPLAVGIWLAERRSPAHNTVTTR